MLRKAFLSEFSRRLALLLIVVTVGVAAKPPSCWSEQDLPVIVPDLPTRQAHITNQITFDQLRRINGVDPENKGLVIDLGDPSLQGTIFTGPYPFEAGEADYDYTRYRLSSPLVNGKGVLGISDLFKAKYNANDWPNSPWPMTTTLAYRLNLWSMNQGTPEILGFFDSIVSFRKDGDIFHKNLTIVEGPFVALVTSDDPSVIMIALETDELCKAEVTVHRVGGNQVQIKVGRDDYRLDNPMIFSGTQNQKKHCVKISGLKPSTEYVYFVQCETINKEKVKSNLYRFFTAPEKGTGSVTLAFSGDSREGIGGGEMNYMGINFSTLSRITMDAYRRGAEVFLFGGDLVNGYTSDMQDLRLQFRGWKQAMAGFWRSRPVYTCMGNHETLLNAYDDGTGSGVFLDKWPYDEQSGEAVFASEFLNPANGPKPSDPRRPPYTRNVYKFQYGSVLIVAFNNNYWWTTDKKIKNYGGSPQGYIMEDQLEWIESALNEAESNPTVRYIVLYGHTPVFPCGGHLKDTMWWNGNNNVRAYTNKNGSLVPEKLGIIEVRNRLWRAISQSKKVAAVLTSDEHEYHRTLITDKTPVGVYPLDDTDGDGVLDKYSADPGFWNPTWHFTLGTAGAPYYARENTPWKPVFFSSQEGYALIQADNERISLKFISITGQVVDEIGDLMAAKR